MIKEEIKELLIAKFEIYNKPNFINDDPISIPHAFSLKQDIEISGLFAATLAWGQRKTIINNCKKLMHLMDNSPYSFIKSHTENDLKPFLGFVHRTFNDTDLLYFFYFLKRHYMLHDSLEDAFLIQNKSTENTKNNLLGFKNYFTESINYPNRTGKHVSSPAKNSACKRLNMYLRWMVRKDQVDFGIWNRLKTSQLIIPCDVHVERAATHMGLCTSTKASWKMAVEITESLASIDPNDPVKFDFALFGMSVEKYF